MCRSCSAHRRPRRRSRLVEAVGHAPWRRRPIAVAGRASHRRHRGRVGHRRRRGGPPRRPDGGRRRPRRHAARRGWPCCGRPSDRTPGSSSTTSRSAGIAVERARPARRSASASCRDSCSTCSTSTGAGCVAAICSTCSPTCRSATPTGSGSASPPGSASAATPASSGTTIGPRGCEPTPHRATSRRGAPRTPAATTSRRRDAGGPVAAADAAEALATFVAEPASRARPAGAHPALERVGRLGGRADRTTASAPPRCSRSTRPSSRRGSTRLAVLDRLRHLDAVGAPATVASSEPCSPPSSTSPPAGSAGSAPASRSARWRCRRARRRPRDRARRRRRLDAAGTLDRPADQRRRPRCRRAGHSDAVADRAHRQFLGVLDSADRRRDHHTARRSAHHHHPPAVALAAPRSATHQRPRVASHAAALLRHAFPAHATEHRLRGIARAGAGRRIRATGSLIADRRRRRRHAGARPRAARARAATTRSPSTTAT